MREQEKSWHWYRREKWDTEFKQNMAHGCHAIEAEARATVRKPRITSVFTRLFWGRQARRFAMSFCIDGGEGDIYFYFILPWLFGVSVSLNCDWAWFKAKWPMLNETSGSKRWGFSIDRNYVSLDWNSYEDSMCSSNKRTGFRWVAEWVDLIKGRCTGVTWKEPHLVLDVCENVNVTYKTHTYEGLGEPCPDGSRDISTNFKVFAKEGTWHYPRWWNMKLTRYEVTYDQTFLVPGKGENSWDCGDERVRSVWDDEYKSASYSCAAKSPEEAVDMCIASIQKKMCRR